jgi:hypothetical protein
MDERSRYAAPAARCATDDDAAPSLVAALLLLLPIGVQTAFTGYYAYLFIRIAHIEPSPRVWPSVALVGLASAMLPVAQGLLILRRRAARECFLLAAAAAALSLCLWIFYNMLSGLALGLIGAGLAQWQRRGRDARRVRGSEGAQ